MLAHATGLIVHSAYVEGVCRERGFRGPIWRVPHPAWSVPEGLPQPGLPAQRGPVIGCFGYLTPSKRLVELLDAFARARRELPGSLFVLAGAEAPGVDIARHVEDRGLQDDVVHLDYLDEPRLWALLGAADVCVSLRWPTMGETSGIVLRAMSLGRPLVVSDAGWFAELPDTVVAKIPIDEWEVETLAAVLVRLGNDPSLRLAMGEAALALARRDHQVDHVAGCYAAALEESAGRESVEAAVLYEVAEAAAAIGLEAGSPELAELSKRLREVGL